LGTSSRGKKGSNFLQKEGLGKTVVCRTFGGKKTLRTDGQTVAKFTGEPDSGVYWESLLKERTGWTPQSSTGTRTLLDFCGKKNKKLQKKKAGKMSIRQSRTNELVQKKLIDTEARETADSAAARTDHRKKKQQKKKKPQQRAGKEKKTQLPSWDPAANSGLEKRSTGGTHLPTLNKVPGAKPGHPGMKKKRATGVEGGGFGFLGWEQEKKTGNNKQTTVWPGQ